MMLKETTPMQPFLSGLFARLSPSRRALHLPTSPTTSPSQSPSPICNGFERIFRHFDEDGDGKISPAELSRCMETIGEELPIEVAEAVVACMDSDGDGLLGFDDMARLVEAEEEEERGRNLRQAFGVYEMRGEECITPKSLGRALERLGQPRSEEECEAMIRRFDINGDGVISFDEFMVMMC